MDGVIMKGQTCFLFSVHSQAVYLLPLWLYWGRFLCQSSSPCSFLSKYFQRRRVADQLVQSADEVREARTCRAVLLPAVQHQLVQVGGAVRGRGQPVVLLYGIDYLTGRKVIVIQTNALT